MYWDFLFSFFIDDDFLLLAFAAREDIPVEDLFRPYLAMPVGQFFRPLALATFIGEYAVFGMEGGAYHFLRILIHSGNAVLVLLIMRSLVGERGLHMLSLFVALIFALHPRAVQTVSSVYCLPDLLSTSAILAVSLLVLRSSEGREALTATAVFMVTFIGLLYKEIGVVMPALILLLGLLRRGTLAGIRSARASILASLGAVLAYLVLRFLALGQLGVGDTLYATPSLVNSISFIARAIVAFFLPPTVVTIIPKLGWQYSTLLSMSLCILAGAGAYYAIKRHRPDSGELRPIVILLGISCLSLLPASIYSFSLRTMQENRFLYVSLPFLATSVMMLLSLFLGKPKIIVGVMIPGMVMVGLVTRAEAGIALDAHMISNRIFEGYRVLRTELYLHEAIVVLDTPRLYRGSGTGVPAEGISLAIERESDRIESRLPALHVLTETHLLSLEPDVGPTWVIEGDTLRGSADPERAFFLRANQVSVGSGGHAPQVLTSQRGNEVDPAHVAYYPASPLLTSAIHVRAGAYGVRIVNPGHINR